ncbi:MAG TPA: sigma-70 family RNA polymerase sigma factor [Mucilaginibacter sp.]
MKQYSDAQLILKLQSGDDTAFKEIYDRYADKLIAIALKKTGHEDEAMDMVQELFLAFWKNRYTIQLNGSLEAYLVVSVNYMACKWYKKQKHQLQVLSILPEQEGYNEDSTYQKLNLSELNHAINKGIEAMPEKMRQVYLYSREQNMNGQQIAEELGISHQTVRNQISSALARLKKIVDQYYRVIPYNNSRELLLLLLFFHFI